jgi:ketosteroid isomerase-like protein
MGYLDEYTRRRVAAVLLVIGLVIVALAIADLGPFDDPPTEAERVEQTVEDFFGAAREGDFQGFCGLLTKDARVLVEQRAAAIAEESGVSGCAEVLELLAGEQLADNQLEIEEVSISGYSARVETELKLTGEKGRSQRTLLLQRQDDRWRITDAGFG